MRASSFQVRVILAGNGREVKCSRPLLGLHLVKSSQGEGQIEKRWDRLRKIFSERMGTNYFRGLRLEGVSYNVQIFSGPQVQFSDTSVIILFQSATEQNIEAG
jgi:hypothetical protein